MTQEGVQCPTTVSSFREDEPLPPAKAQRAHDPLRISFHVMTFPRRSCMNGHQRGTFWTGHSPRSIYEHSASHVVSAPSHHEVVNAKTQRNGLTRMKAHHSHHSAVPP